MTLSEKTARPQGDSISLDFDLDHRPEKVWRALTEPALLAEWLLPVAGLELEPGAPFRFQTQPHPEWDGVVDCRILEIEPKRKLSYTWRVGDMALDTVVTFILTPTDSGTRLSLLHSGFKPEQKRNLNGARYGWKMMGGKLVDVLAGMH